MSQLRITTEQTSYRPGELVRGQIHWMLAETPRWIELRLFWFTRGKGTTDVVQVNQVRYETPPTSGEKNFQFTMPQEPFSYTGTLVSIVWALELVVDRGPTERVELVMSPTAREITTT